MSTITVSLPPKQMDLLRRLLEAARPIAWVELDATLEDVDDVIDLFVILLKAHLAEGKGP